MLRMDVSVFRGGKLHTADVRTSIFCHGADKIMAQILDVDARPLEEDGARVLFFFFFFFLCSIIFMASHVVERYTPGLFLSFLVLSANRVHVVRFDSSGEICTPDLADGVKRKEERNRYFSKHLPARASALW